MITIESVISSVISSLRQPYSFCTLKGVCSRIRIAQALQKKRLHYLKDNEETILAGAIDPTVL